MLLLTGIFISSALSIQCGPAVSPVTTQAIIQVESGGNPFAIGDNTVRKSFAPRSKIEAIGLATTLLSQGHNIDIGLMQINSQHLNPMKLSVSELFDPCTNIRIGTSILADFYRLHDTIPDKNQVLFRALSSYNTGSAWRGPGYINKILAQVNAPYRVRLKKDVLRSSRTDRPPFKSSPKIRPESSPLFFSGIECDPEIRWK